MLTCTYHPSAIQTSFPHSFPVRLVLFVKSSLQTAAKHTSVTLTSENFSFSVVDWKIATGLWEFWLPHWYLCWWPVVPSLLCFHTCLSAAGISTLKLKIAWPGAHRIVLCAESLKQQGQMIDFSNINWLASLQHCKWTYSIKKYRKNKCSEK